MAAFFDKIGSMAKNVADKASDTLEINRINSKVNGEQRKITALKAQLGEYIWTRHLAGDTFSEEAQAYFNQIQASLEVIAAMQAEIETIRVESELRQASAGSACTSCGMPLNVSAELNFCPQCGAKVEPPPAPEEETPPQEEPSQGQEILCTGCGELLLPDQKFCGTCGTYVSPVQQ